MFDIGFWELVVVGVVALIVIGPERLPGVARTVGVWVGRMRRLMANVNADIQREIKADELKRIMNEQAKSSGLHEIIEETRAVADELNRTGNLAHEPATPAQPEAGSAVPQTAAPALSSNPNETPTVDRHG